MDADGKEAVAKKSIGLCGSLHRGETRTSLEIARHEVLKGKPVKAGADENDDIANGRQGILIKPEDFAEDPLGPVALDGRTDTARGNDAQPAARRRLSPGLGQKSLKKKRTAIYPSAPPPHGGKICSAPDTLPCIKALAHGGCRAVNSGGKTLAPFAAASGNHFAATTGGLTRAKAEFALTADFGRSVSWLHRI